MRLITVKKSPKNERYIMLRKGLGFFYAEKNGRAVLKGETSWKKICGIWINTNKGCYWIQVRRHHNA